MRSGSIVILWYMFFLLIALLGGTGLQSLSLVSFLYFLVILCFFLLGMIFSNILIPKGNCSFLCQNKNLTKKCISTICTIYYLFIAFSILVMLNVYIFNSIDISFYRNSFFDGSRGNIKYFFGSLGFYSYYLVSLFIYASVPFVITLSGERKIKFLCFLSLLFYDVVFLSRTGVYYYIISYMISCFILNRKMKGLIILCLIVLCLSLLMSHFRDAQENIISVLLSAILNYHIAPFLLFDMNIISKGVIHYDGFGMASLGIYNIILYPIEPSIMSSINDFRQQLNVFYDLGVKNYYPYNAYYTSMGMVYIDGGILACIMVSFLSGSLIVLFERRSYRSNRFLASTVFFTALCLESIFSPVTLNIFAFTIIVYFLIMMVLKYESCDAYTLVKKHGAK